MLRHGRHVEAAAYAEGAAGDQQIAFRALSVAGRAAHLASREEAALALFERAEQIAGSDAELRDARWGQLTCAIDLELRDAGSALDELSAGVSLGDVREVVRMATHRVYLQLRTGVLRLEEAETANQLVDAAGDPIVESSFLSGYAIALALGARYADAAIAARRLLQRAERYRLDFTVPYALCAMAMAHAGRREWLEAEEAASEALERATTRQDVHADLLSRSVLVRLYTQQARLPAALEVVVDQCQGALSASIAEAACSRALALACAGRIDDAYELVNDARDTTRAIEPAVLIPAVEAVCALRGGSSDALERAALLGEATVKSGALDLLVTTYRACPELLSILLRGSENRPFRSLVERVGDADLARAAGHPIAANDDRRLLLSPREREVFELLRNGFSNRQIAKLLYIEPSTVKVHAHHIYDKLGVRSRSALTVQAALERSGQATSAIDSSALGGDSS
jgi:DNA-binding NarL/FixJ family response regulator